MKLKKFAINIVGCLLFWNKDLEHRVKYFLNNISISNYLKSTKFKHNKTTDNSVLLIEVNNCHGEVVGGYIEYFKNLGYNINCILNSEFEKDNPFCRQNMKNVKCFYLNPLFLEKCLKYKYTKKYKHIVVMSSTVYGGMCWASIFDNIPDLKQHPSLYIVEHELSCIETQQEQEYLDKNHIIVLGKFDRGVFVNPCLFGDVKITQKNKIPTFITVGAIESLRKNHAELISAMQKLIKQKLKFKVVIIGRGELNSLPDEIKPYIEITGRLKFQEMFEQMEKADFFLPLLDPNNPEHERYITTGVTGSAQLIYAFEKVPVIHKKFADFYRFNNKNAIVFDNDLATAMADAISLTDTEYKFLQSNLHKTKKDIEKESFDNLKRMLG